jgi:CBS domain-containing protein
MHVKDLMSHPVVTCTRNDHLDVPARLMWEFDCGIVPVVDADGRVEGVITDRDICMAAYTQGKSLNAIPVASAMAIRILACHVDDSIESAERVMRDGQVRRLPVLDATGRLQGLISLNDIARRTAEAKKSAVDRELVETFAAICRPRVAREPIERARPVALAPTA